MVFFYGLQKYLAALFLIMLCASASFAETNDLGLFSALTADSNDDSPKNISVELNNDCFTYHFIKFAHVSTAVEHNDLPVRSLIECLEEIPSLTLHKDGNNPIWSLAPLLSKYSLNPIDDIKNIQVLLQYRF